MGMLKSVKTSWIRGRIFAFALWGAVPGQQVFYTMMGNGRDAQRIYGCRRGKNSPRENLIVLSTIGTGLIAAGVFSQWLRRKRDDHPAAP
jgi:hypothetical protein